MEEQIFQGGGVFEITDYTTASDWERFIASLEEILTDWKLQKHSNQDQYYRDLPYGFISEGFWHEKREVLRFGSLSFDVKYQYLDDSNLKDPEKAHKPKTIEDSPRSNQSDSSEFQDAEDDISSLDSISNVDILHRGRIQELEKEHGEHELPENVSECLRDLMSTSNDFASKAHCLVRWYSLRRFIILSPKADTIMSEDRTKLILSSASIALANIDCHIPVFVQIHNPKNNFYQGISEHFNTRTTYEMIYFRKGSRQYSYLSELISMFREKTCSSLNDPISATIRLNYCLSTFDLFVRPVDEFGGNEHSDDEEDEVVRMTTRTNPNPKIPRGIDMRSGATFEQVVEVLDESLPHPYKILKFLHVAALWPPLSDKVITDSQVHSDLDPAEAPIWTIRCVTSDNCHMRIVHETKAVYELLCGAVDYAYETLDANTAFRDCDINDIKSKCLKLSYQLATQPEVVFSENQTDPIRKIIALLFYKAAELTTELDALHEIADQLKKRPSLSEIYRNFNRVQKPSVKEFIIRSQISRPFNSISTPALPQRMFCTICEEEFRLCGAFSELCN